MIAARDARGSVPPRPGRGRASSPAPLPTRRHHLSTGPRGADLADLLLRAKSDPTALPAAIDALDRLAGLDRRHVLASYATPNRPAA